MSTIYIKIQNIISKPLFKMGRLPQHYHWKWIQSEKPLMEAHSVTLMSSCSLSRITWILNVIWAGGGMALIRAAVGREIPRTVWFCSPSRAQTSSSGSRRWCRRCYQCVVCGSPKSPLSAPWQETWAPGWGYPAASLASRVGGGEKRCYLIDSWSRVSPKSPKQTLVLFPLDVLHWRHKNISLLYGNYLAMQWLFI